MGTDFKAGTRVDTLARPLTRMMRTLWVEHPGRFNPGDIGRVVGTGEAFRVVEVRADRVMVNRAIGSLRRTPVDAGEQVLIVGRANGY